MYNIYRSQHLEEDYIIVHKRKDTFKNSSFYALIGQAKNYESAIATCKNHLGENDFIVYFVGVKS